MFQGRELCLSFNLFFYIEQVSVRVSLISERNNQTVLASGSLDFSASSLPELSGKHTSCPASRLLGPWDVTQAKPVVPWKAELGDSSSGWEKPLSSASNPPYLVRASSLSKQCRMSTQIHLEEAYSLYHIKLVKKSGNGDEVNYFFTPNSLF